MKYLSSKAAVIGVVALAAGDLGVSAGDGSSFLETFTATSWEESWSYSSDEKYNGKFAVETMVEGTDDTGLKVGLLDDVLTILIPGVGALSRLTPHICLARTHNVGDGEGQVLRCGDASSDADRSLQGQDCSAVRAQGGDAVGVRWGVYEVFDCDAVVRAEFTGGGDAVYGDVWA